MRADEVMAELAAMADPERAANLARFFKTGPGEYGEGDRFIGLRVPQQRAVAKRYRRLPLVEIDLLLQSPIHEHRLTGLVILVEQYRRAKESTRRREIVTFYLAHLHRINNWDLVDLSAPKILGLHLMEHRQEREMLFTLVTSDSLWERRVAVLATAPMIRQGEFQELLQLAETLLTDSHDLMHKAVGWMLREMGKIALAPLVDYLEQRAAVMPRTMLRYAIEKMDAEQRRYFMTRKLNS
ncbi:MAG: DNA alkylation repair protein [Magnetococcales bacterium]|nr:DNA alkylation repair protein [Magnetococcales bacterium]